MCCYVMQSTSAGDCRCESNLSIWTLVGLFHSLPQLLHCHTLKYIISVAGMQEMPEKLFKVIIIGDPTVGKTSFVQRYVQNTYKKDYKGTVGVDFALKILKWSEAQTVKLQLWDIAGKIFLSCTTKFKLN